MAAHLCAKCKVNWPAEVVKPGPLMEARCRCPICGNLCGIMHSTQPVDPSVAKHMIFDDYWAKREQRLIEAQEREIADLPTAA